jgi:tRNA 2-selenouridine synthase
LGTTFLQPLVPLDPDKRVWVENESRSIGRVFIPDGFWFHMRAASLVNIRVPEEARIQNLLADYVLSDRTELEIAFQKIASKLGG